MENASFAKHRAAEASRYDGRPWGLGTQCGHRADSLRGTCRLYGSSAGMAGCASWRVANSTMVLRLWGRKDYCRRRNFRGLYQAPHAHNTSGESKRMFTGEVCISINALREIGRKKPMELSRTASISRHQLTDIPSSLPREISVCVVAHTCVLV